MICPVLPLRTFPQDWRKIPARRITRGMTPNTAIPSRSYTTKSCANLRTQWRLGATELCGRSVQSEDQNFQSLKSYWKHCCLAMWCTGTHCPAASTGSTFPTSGRRGVVDVDNDKKKTKKQNVNDNENNLRVCLKKIKLM